MLRINSARTVAVLATIAASVVLTAACSSTPKPAPTAPPPQSTLPPVKETVIIKETVIVQPTAAPAATATATATITPTTAPGSKAPAATKPPAQGGKLDFTADDIEYALSAQRQADKKVQLTITLRPKGGVPPYSFVLDPGGVENRIKGLTFTFGWHNCNESEPHSIVLYSSDGQKVGPVSFIPPYNCP